MKCYIKDYPRPQMVRKNWLNLNGEWDFSFDDNNNGEKEGYQNGFNGQTKIRVPFTYETEQLGDEKMSSIMNPNNKVMHALARLADLMLLVIAACIFLLAAFFRLLAPVALLVGISGPGYFCAKIYDKAFEKLEKKDD
jgi:hypothetical protein